MFKNFGAQIIFFISIFLSVTGLHAENFFEGAVTFKMTHGNKVSSMRHFIKGSKMRMEISAGPALTSVGIADYDKEKLYMVMPQTGMYMEMDINVEDLSSSANTAVENSEVTKTEETENILGYTCTKWQSKQKNQITDMWIAKGFGKFYQPDIGSQNSPLALMRKQLEAEEGFPFRVVQRSANGAKLFEMEVTKVEKKPLVEDLFKVPDGYKKLDIPSGVAGKP